MEYCIELLVPVFDPMEGFTAPEIRQTVWGPAVRPTEEGKWFWRGGLYVREVPMHAFITRLLPTAFQREDWVCLCIGGNGLQDFEALLNWGAEEDCGKWEEHPLILLLTRLLQDQSRWAAFFRRDCDRMGGTFEDSRPQFLQRVRSVYQHSYQGDGFCSLHGL